MPLSRRDLLRASAGVAVTAACTPTVDSRQASPGRHGGPSPARTTGRPADATSGGPDSRVPPEASGSGPDGPATEVAHGPRTRPMVALTCHGSGDPAVATRLLQLLRSHDVQVSVLAVGTWLRAEPRMAGRILDAGHDLGNHTLHHYPMRSLSATQAYDEVVGCARTLRRLTGSARVWFRASGTQATTPRIRRAAGRAGYRRCISYDVDGLDWQDPASATVESAVLGSARRGSIVSLHLGHEVTLAALPAILSGLRDKGLRPVTLTSLLA